MLDVHAFGSTGSDAGTDLYQGSGLEGVSGDSKN